ncbi:O-antigen ligase-like membrane protein [Mucilaginibacter oryzae]|uniref:O-antigen ligase-like membrane protein n=1 Tax=Mucilaginibacter oryzae TaxID=468058 RepID=A0A316HH17_9SPHI|nr:O-antigen ligase family protein [Mucilaginibacter oryzae]PWK79351.1 O-antigen ligase-like membrane protein [Mucilaginibacter oryzae]
MAAENRLVKVFFVVSLAVLLGFVVAHIDVAGTVGLIALPFVALYLIWIFNKPVRGLYTVLYAGFFANGMVRYSTAPFGLSIDIFLLITLIAALAKPKKGRALLLRNPFVYAISVWTAFTIFEIINPEARSFAAWFYSVRGTALYMIQLVVLTTLLIDDKKGMLKFVNIWIFCSALAAIYGMKQLYLGVNHAEQVWLDAGAYKTHLLFGRLRVFSFYSDAGQFGAAMGHILLVCLILSLGPVKRKLKLGYLALSLLFFWAMAISGTRGALFVPLSGFMVYLFLTKNFKILSVGIAVVVILFGLLKFTTVGAGNYQVQRMRSALDPNDPSLQVRLDNQKKFAAYLKSRPIGGGIGSAGSWGQRFSPGTFLAETPTDSWYVKIWAETGIVGLWIHLGMIITIAITGTVMIFRMKNDLQLRQISMALFSGYIGIAFASYSNQVIGQAPSGIVVFMSIGLIWLAYKWDKAGQSAGNNETKN